MSTPTKNKYEKALKIVKEYEYRQNDLTKLNKDLGYSLEQFTQIKFDINENKKEITFTGVTKDDKLKLTKSVARSGDKFELVIGKLIAVKKALGEDIKHIERFIDNEDIDIPRITISNGDLDIGVIMTKTPLVDNFK